MKAPNFPTTHDGAPLVCVAVSCEDNTCFYARDSHEAVALAQRLSAGYYVLTPIYSAGAWTWAETLAVPCMQP